MGSTTAGSRFLAAIAEESPLQCVGAINAYHARLAEQCGFKALYLSGGGVAASSCGIPDLGITTMEDVLTDLRRITDVTDVPVLVDIDTGWGGALNIARSVKAMNRCGAAAVHIEDQQQQKRCGHRPNKVIVSTGEMVDRIKACVDARQDDDFIIMARTDSLANEGMQSAIDRSATVEAGAAMLFPEAFTTIDQYRQYADAVQVPVLANITEFGKTPLFTVEELRSAGISIALYPLSAFRAANAAAMNVYRTLKDDGTQQSLLSTTETRDQLYERLGYHEFEQKLDRLFAEKDEESPN